jgi:hypothetical protein
LDKALKQAVGNLQPQARLQSDKQEAHEQLLSKILGILKNSHLIKRLNLSKTKLNLYHMQQRCVQNYGFCANTSASLQTNFTNAIKDNNDSYLPP